MTSHEIFSRDDAIQQKTLCSNLDGPVKRSKEALKNDENTSLKVVIQEPPVVKSQKNKLPERKKRVEDLVGLFKEFMQDRKEEEGRKGKTEQIRNYAQ